MDCASWRRTLSHCLPGSGMHKPPYRKHQEPWLIELRLSNPRQLFNTIDPSPFHEKDLDEAAERYIVGAVEDFPDDASLKLVLHLPEEHRQDEVREQLASALRNYFGWRVQETRRDLSHVLRDGRLTLLIGLSFLVFCTVSRQLAVHYTDGFMTTLLDEGLLIIGWVALWRPIQTFLYDWWPVRRRLRTLRRIVQLSTTLTLQ
jgi:hypothetical protein